MTRLQQETWIRKLLRVQVPALARQCRANPCGIEINPDLQHLRRIPRFIGCVVPVHIPFPASVPCYTSALEIGCKESDPPWKRTKKYTERIGLRERPSLRPAAKLLAPFTGTETLFPSCFLKGNPLPGMPHCEAGHRAETSLPGHSVGMSGCLLQPIARHSSCRIDASERNPGMRH